METVLYICSGVALCFAAILIFIGVFLIGKPREGQYTAGSYLLGLFQAIMLIMMAFRILGII